MNIIARLYDSILANRLSTYVQMRGGTAQTQYAFRTGYNPIKSVEALLTKIHILRCKRIVHAIMHFDFAGTS